MVRTAGRAKVAAVEPPPVRLNTPSFSVYRGKPTEEREIRPGDVVLTRAQRLPGLAAGGYDVLYEKNGIVMIRIRP